MSDLPTAELRAKPRFSFVWFVPLFCLGIVVFYGWSYVRSLGPEITILFPDADGLVPDKTEIKHRGVTVGKVTGVDIALSSAAVKVTARLRREAKALAREGTVFIVIKPQVSFQGVEGLTTIFSGSSLDLRPGEGPPATAFKGYSDSRDLAREKDGLKLTLTTPHNMSIEAGDGVYYRGLRVGDVTQVDIGPTGQKVMIHVKIDRRYDQFVRHNSKFWAAGGIDAKIGLLGAKVRVNSVQALWNGGVAFATPNEPGNRVKDGHPFTLEPKVDPEWDAWSPDLARR